MAEAETKELTFDQDDEKEIKELWQLIDAGYSVVKATYSAKKRRFKIKFSDGLWPAITVPCSTCGIRMPPVYLSFSPYPAEGHTCIVCRK